MTTSKTTARDKRITALYKLDVPYLRGIVSRKHRVSDLKAAGKALLVSMIIDAEGYNRNPRVRSAK